MFGYARGYVSCLPKGSTATIELARGTSNYHPSLPSAYTAGVRWARETNRLGRMLARKGLDTRVEAAAADDAEPAWDPAFRQTRIFFHGFRAGCTGTRCTTTARSTAESGRSGAPRQAWFVSGGLRNTKALPEIYNSAMAKQWAELARIARITRSSRSSSTTSIGKRMKQVWDVARGTDQEAVTRRQPPLSEEDPEAGERVVRDRAPLADHPRRSVFHEFDDGGRSLGRLGRCQLPNDWVTELRAGYRRTMKIGGKIRKTRGKSILIGAFCARSSAD
jgi:hypothetical protein